MNWKEIKSEPSQFKRFMPNDDEPEVLYIFRSGFSSPQLYHVLQEDPFFPAIHKLLSKEEIKEKYGIEVE